VRGPEVRGQIVAFGLQPGGPLLQGGDPVGGGISYVPDETDGVLTHLLELGPQPFGLLCGLCAQVAAFPGRVSQGLRDELARVGAGPVELGPDADLRGACPRRLVASLPRRGRGFLEGLIMLAGGQGDPLVGVLPGRFQLGQVPGAQARGDRAVRDDPGPETGQGRPGSQRQP
jgi:hypothetical protein